MAGQRDFGAWSREVLRHLEALSPAEVRRTPRRLPVLDCRPIWEAGYSPRAAAYAICGLHGGTGAREKTPRPERRQGAGPERIERRGDGMGDRACWA